MIDRASVAFAILATTFVLFFNLACNSSPMDTVERLPAPKLLPSPPDTALVEIGIDAVEFGDFIQLDWEPAAGAKPAGYRIYRSEDVRTDFTMLVDLMGERTTYIDSSGIELGTRYYYFITALDDDRAESLPSDTLSYLLIEKASLLSNTNEPRPTFFWHVGAIPAEYYVLKLIEADTDRRIWVTRVKSSYSQSEQVKFNQDGTAAVDSLSVGVSYKWRVDIIGPASNSGSESPWKSFVLQ
ncbi:MAG: hypothetical protein Q9P14_04280 [candidate division KSB1 bacterium]|nr:hypothetical protein [candidate division KSB1 bacterium]MDQ7064235.1 hypothetical protein [candidate division KSB1 bacterium]